jgi:hypothetical protein
MAEIEKGNAFLVEVSGYRTQAEHPAATVLTPLPRRRAELAVIITQVLREFLRPLFGAPRTTAELRNQGEAVAAEPVAKIMASIRPRRSHRVWPTDTSARSGSTQCG